MYRVLVSDNLSSHGVKLLEEAEGIEVVVNTDLAKDPAALKAALADFDGIIIRSGTKLKPEILEGQTRLKAVARAGVGVDNVDLPTATKQGIVVMNTPAGNTISTAEQTFALMLAMSRNIAPAAAAMKAGGWDRKKFTGAQLAGKTLGVIGLGRIGLAVAKRGLAFEMDVIGYDPFFTAEKAAEHGLGYAATVEELVPKVDYLTAHTPLTDATRNLIDAEMLKKMKPSARIVNCARGGIYDEEAVADALEAGTIAGAAFDVYTQEPPPEDFRLRTIPSALCAPHLGASTDEAQELVAVEAAELMIGYLTRGEIKIAVNTASVSQAEAASTRIYLDLGYRLGSLASQLCGGAGVKRATLTYRGEVATKKYGLVTSAFTKGLLDAAIEGGANMINATSLAKDRGIELVETVNESAGDFSTRVGVKVETESGSVEVDGTVFGNQYLRLIGLDGFHLESLLDGTLLIYRHEDRPGVIGAIGSVLGKHEINIADMALGRSGDSAGGSSVAVLHLDSEPTAEVVAEVAALPHVTGVDVVKLPGKGEAIAGVTA